MGATTHEAIRLAVAAASDHYDAVTAFMDGIDWEPGSEALGQQLVDQALALHARLRALLEEADEEKARATGLAGVNADLARKLSNPALHPVEEIEHLAEMIRDVRMHPGRAGWPCECVACAPYRAMVGA